jgi:hypothetical protein
MQMPVMATAVFMARVIAPARGNVKAESTLAYQRAKSGLWRKRHIGNALSIPNKRKLKCPGNTTKGTRFGPDSSANLGVRTKHVG